MGASTANSSATFQNPLQGKGLQSDLATIAPTVVGFSVGEGVGAAAGAALGSSGGRAAIDNIDGKSALDASKAETASMQSSEDALVQEEKDQVQQQNSSAAAVATRNAARQAQLTAAANYTGFSGTILTSPLGLSGQNGNTVGKTVLGS